MKQTKGRAEDALHATPRRCRRGHCPRWWHGSVAGHSHGEEGGRGTDRRRACFGAEIIIWPWKSRPASSPRITGEDGRCHRRRDPHPGREVAEHRLQRQHAETTSTCSREGIVDPTRVTKSALNNAASIASLMLTTEVMITKIDEDEPANKVQGSDPLRGLRRAWVPSAAPDSPKRGVVEPPEGSECSPRAPPLQTPGR